MATATQSFLIQGLDPEKQVGASREFADTPRQDITCQEQGSSRESLHEHFRASERQVFDNYNITSGKDLKLAVEKLEDNLRTKSDDDGAVSGRNDDSVNREAVN